MKTKKNKIAILSGTFNPIHNSHIALAKYVQEACDYDKIMLIPAYNPPFKENIILPNHRYKMVELAKKGIPGVDVSDIEFRRKGKSYSYITIKEIYEKYKPKEKIGFIIGTDAYKDLDKWYCANELKKLVDFLVFERGISFEDKIIKQRMAEGFKLIRMEMPFNDISSSEIRKFTKKGKNISEYVPEEVERYIKENDLYK